jgi:hypothetical protein
MFIAVAYVAKVLTTKCFDFLALCEECFSFSCAGCKDVETWSGSLLAEGFADIVCGSPHCCSAGLV